MIATLMIGLHLVATSSTKKCNPCMTKGQFRSTSENKTFDDIKEFYLLTMNELSNLFDVLNSTYNQEIQFQTVGIHDDILELNCPHPKKKLKWAICVYNKISTAVKNIEESAMYSPTLNTEDIAINGKKVLCHFRLFLMDICKNPKKCKRVERKLSRSACNEVQKEKQIMPTPQEMNNSLHSLSRLKSIVLSLHKDILCQVNKEGGETKCRRRRKTKQAKHKIRGCQNKKSNTKRKCKRKRNKGRRHRNRAKKL
ncbi:Hypothetical predicted protein [Mytilus galloprovincialis]|uniref:Interleukin-7 n=1 Tax=Mytilus galloprovincialis TaxID=29158 RepID=A0A8B6FWC8_MYTGA|nr:Hypothetical predicted protein [Mytilus galloprovincialis]